MNRHLTWRHLKALHQLYTLNRTDAKITDNSYIANVLIAQKKLLKPKSGNIKIIEATPRFKDFYEENFQQDYDRYSQFLQNQDLEDDARRKYTEEDIQTLFFIADHKKELSQNLTTIRTFSSELFKGHGSKYLENKSGLKKAVCKILGIKDFPDRDPKNYQWRLVVDCINPKAIILCENIAHLKAPWKVREVNIELWYVGGNNIGMIDFISSEKLLKPIYYSCDWDFHGLSIYSRIKAKLNQKSAVIKILEPYTLDTAIPVKSEHHKSKWNFNLSLSGLNLADFNANQISLIQSLIKGDKWIEEESMDILQLYYHSASTLKQL
jgi:hypothetical protein